MRCRILTTEIEALFGRVRRLKRAGASYALLYLVMLELSLGALVPTAWVYRGRMDYELVKDNPGDNIDVVIERVRAAIERERLNDYLILLGDSVTYSGPGGPEQSLAPALEAVSQRNGRPLRVFNLAMPAMQTGDIYVMLLKLREHGIEPPRLAINLIYAGFAPRAPDPPAVFWLAADLRRLDPDAYARVRANLAANGRDGPPPGLADWFREHVTGRLALVRYRDILRARFLIAIPWRQRREVYDTHRWDQKPGLRELLRGREYRMLFNPAPFVMDETNPQLYFIRRIREAAPHAQILFWLSPVNQVLMADEVREPGYQANVVRIDRWFRRQPVRFVNLEHALPPGLFADHLHLTPEGYQVLARRLHRTLLDPA